MAEGEREGKRRRGRGKESHSSATCAKINANPKSNNLASYIWLLSIRSCAIPFPGLIVFSVSQECEGRKSLCSLPHNKDPVVKAGLS